jgi:transglutaminase-like putative cysteine protease
MARQVSVVLAMVAALLLAFFAIAAQAGEPPMTIVRAQNSFDVHADGTYTSLYHLELRTANDAAARHEGQQAFSYSPQIEDLEIVEAATHKADGRVLPVDAASIHDQLPPGASDRALITDLREKVLVFPDLAGGDTLSYTLRRTVRRAVFPGRFLFSAYLSRGAPLLDYTLTVRAPKSLALHAEAFEMSYSEDTQGDSVVRRWHGAIPQASDETAAVGPFDRLPRVFVSSEPNYAAFARDYATLVAPHLAVTPHVQALADRLTAGIAGRREQARALYEWVSAHVRYVAVYLAAGALEPHDADTVLAHGWGDCKDHAVLLQALLSARGIAAQLVMLNLGAHYTLSGPPTFAQLNHAISYLPEFDLYVDSTAALAPFGTLPFSEYGKPAVHAIATGIVLRQTPPLPPGAASMELRTTATLLDDGSITGTSTTTASGPFAIELRRDAAWIEATGSSAGATQLRALGTEGNGSFSYAPPEQLADTYAISGSFTLDARPELLDGDSFSPPYGLRLLAHAGDELIGPLGQRSLPVGAPTPCYPGRQIEDVSLTLPRGRHLLRLPKDVRVDSDALSYRAVWSQTDATVTRHAELVSRIVQPLCSGELRLATAAALDSIRRAERMHVALSDE